MSTARFRLKIKNDRGLIQSQLEALARQSIQELAYRVVQGTPVDVGFLRGSWQPGINAMMDNDQPANDPSGAAASAKIAGTVIGIKLGDTFYMSNNAKYAMRIEYGFVGEDSLGRYYNQAGRYFVTGAMAQWNSIVAEQALALGFGKGGGSPPASPSAPPPPPPPPPAATSSRGKAQYDLPRKPSGWGKA